MSVHILPVAGSHGPVFLVNSRLGHFSAAASPQPYLSRSYICILPSSLTRILPLACAFSARPPVSVYGTVPRRPHLRGSFSAPRLRALPLPVGRVAHGSPRARRLTRALTGSPLRPGPPSPGRASPHASPRRIRREVREC